MNKAAILVAVALGSAATLVVAAPGFGRGEMVERLRAADTNGDGMISRAEAAALPRLAEKFDQIDANHDNQLSRDELRAYHQVQFAKAVGDTDGDGKVSRAEFMAKAAERFDRLDANKDGFVTPDEMRAARKGHRHHAERS
jgi:Ca2+-binding EF-hand superfamily protein